MKRALFGALAGRRPAATIDPAQLDARQVRRILFVRVNFRMGNLLLVTPALASLHHAFPDATIDLLCGTEYAELLASDPAIDRVITCDRDLHRHPLTFARLVARLRRRRYDLVFDAARGASFLGAFFCWLSGGRLRVAAAGSRYQGFFNVHVPRRHGLWHKVDMLLEHLDTMGIAPARRDPYVVLRPADLARADAVVRELGFGTRRPLVGVNLGARASKQTPLADLLALVGELSRSGRADVLLFIGPDEADVREEVVAAALPHVAIAPALDVRTFAALLARCTVVVSGDTGPMHLAAAVGTPTIALLRTPQSACYAPRGPLDRTLSSGLYDGVAPIVEAVEAIVAHPYSRLAV